MVTADEFHISDSRDREIQHGGHVGIGNDDISTGHGLRQDTAAVEVHGFYVEAVPLPYFVLLDDPAQIRDQACPAAVAQDNRGYLRVAPWQCAAAIIDSSATTNKSQGLSCSDSLCGCKGSRNLYDKPQHFRMPGDPISLPAAKLL